MASKAGGRYIGIDALCPICRRLHRDSRLYGRSHSDQQCPELVLCAACTMWCHEHSQVLQQLQAGRILAGEISLARWEAR